MERTYQALFDDYTKLLEGYELFGAALDKISIATVATDSRREMDVENDFVDGTQAFAEAILDAADDEFTPCPMCPPDKPCNMCKGGL